MSHTHKATIHLYISVLQLSSHIIKCSMFMKMYSSRLTLHTKQEVPRTIYPRQSWNDSENGICCTELLGLWTLSVVRCSKEGNRRTLHFRDRSSLQNVVFFCFLLLNTTRWINSIGPIVLYNLSQSIVQPGKNCQINNLIFPVITKPYFRVLHSDFHPR
jgi:hypothetical protein